MHHCCINEDYCVWFHIFDSITESENEEQRWPSCLKDLGKISWENYWGLDFWMCLNICVKKKKKTHYRKRHGFCFLRHMKTLIQLSAFRLHLTLFRRSWLLPVLTWSWQKGDAGAIHTNIRTQRSLKLHFHRGLQCMCACLWQGSELFQ